MLLTLSALQTKQDTYANSADLDEKAHYESTLFVKIVSSVFVRASLVAIT